MREKERERDREMDNQQWFFILDLLEAEVPPIHKCACVHTISCTTK
jgi:hypothetical protein